MKLGTLLTSQYLCCLHPSVYFRFLPKNTMLILYDKSNLQKIISVLESELVYLKCIECNII